MKIVKIILYGVIALLCLIAWYEFYCKVYGLEPFDMDLTASSGLYVHYINSVLTEEIIYRYLPFIFATCIAVLARRFHKNRLVNLILGIFILAVQILFAINHIVTDEDIRTTILNLPKTPTWIEYFQVLFMQGIGGIILSIFYFTAIDKKKPLYLLQLIPFTATCIVHYAFDIILAVYGKKPAVIYCRLFLFEKIEWHIKRLNFSNIILPIMHLKT